MDYGEWRNEQSVDPYAGVNAYAQRSPAFNMAYNDRPATVDLFHFKWQPAMCISIHTIALGGRGTRICCWTAPSARALNPTYKLAEIGIEQITPASAAAVCAFRIIQHPTDVE